MKIDGDYLWDKTGEPDPDIQQLEETLSTLRYQPRPLVLPATEQTVRRGAFFRNLAIAATIAMMLLGLGLWLGLQRQPTPQVSGTHKTTATGSPESAAAPIKDKNEVLGNDSLAISENNRPRVPDVSSRGLPRNSTPGRRATISSTQLAANKRKEALAAKEQLMLALRVASSKLNFAQKKTQSTNSENLIHNQHKIG